MPTANSADPVLEQTELPTSPDDANDASLFALSIFSQLSALLLPASDIGYIGEPVSQLAHALQAAHFAGQFCDAAGNVSEDDKRHAVLAALLHDVGHLSPHTDIHASMEDPVAGAGAKVNWGTARHEVLGAEYLSDLCFPVEVCELVKSHVMIKRYLCGVDQKYYQNLSEASKNTLRHQGGPLSEKECRELEKDRLLGLKVLVRKADEAAKVPGLEVLDWDGYKGLILDVVGREWTKRNDLKEWVGGHPGPTEAV
jgi:predicted HD phosphohydrolase